MTKFLASIKLALKNRKALTKANILAYAHLYNSLCFQTCFKIAITTISKAPFLDNWVNLWIIEETNCLTHREVNCDNLINMTILQSKNKQYNEQIILLNTNIINMIYLIPTEIQSKTYFPETTFNFAKKKLYISIA